MHRTLQNHRTHKIKIKTYIKKKKINMKRIITNGKRVFRKCQNAKDSKQTTMRQHTI